MPTHLDALQRDLEQSPDNLQLLLEFAQAAEEALQLFEGRQAYERVLDLEPDHMQASLGLARILFLEGKTSEAAVRVERVFLKKGGFAEGHLFLARVLLAEGNRQGALEHFLKARELDSELRDGALEREFQVVATGSKSAKSADVSIGDRGAEAFGEWSPFEETKESDTDESSTDKGGYEDAGFFDFLETSLQRSGLSLGDVDNPELDFGDIAGLDELKELIRMRLLYPFRKPELFAQYGQQAGGSILLYGPPGCGKTRLARSVAGEVDGVSWFSLGLHQILDSHFGRSEKNLHEIFELARQNAPSVILFDEVEMLAGERLESSDGRGVVNQFISELDALAERNPGVLVIGATSAPWQIDTAFLRAGRFDRPMLVSPPDVKAREQIVDLLKTDLPGGEGIDSRKIAKRTRGYSGADLKALFDLASERGLAAAIGDSGDADGDDVVVPLTTKSVLEGMARVKPMPLAWFESARDAVKRSPKGDLFGDVFGSVVAD